MLFLVIILWEKQIVLDHRVLYKKTEENHLLSFTSIFIISSQWDKITFKVAFSFLKPRDIFSTPGNPFLNSKNLDRGFPFHEKSWLIMFLPL